MRRAGSSIIVVSVLSFLCVSRAWADASEANERTARKACLSGDYKKGVEILSDLFINTQNPLHIYNQARCFEQNGHCEEAIHRFREYLRKGRNLGSEDKADVETHIADCQALLGQNSASPPEPKLEPVSPLPPVAPEPKAEPIPAPKSMAEPAQPVAVQPSVEAVALQTAPATTSAPPPSVVVPSASERLVANPATPDPSPGRGLRMAGIACGVVGVGAIGTGVYFYARARSLSDKVSGQKVHKASDLQAGKDAETMQWVFYGIGGAALGTGVLLYALGWPAAPNGQPGVAVVGPMLGPGLAGISAQGAF
jgi:hypothetical protein